ncbi:protease inhibitor I42 family protein [Nocardia brasiliensis]|uniref:protease inhibitor I42 family protein n=1 Tax=Nocardia brasiliensis TaxID=37326 RepID=UPI003D89F179
MIIRRSELSVRKTLLVLLVGLSVVGCGKDDSSDAKPTSAAAPTSGSAFSVLNATQEANGQERRLTIGQSLVLTLPANPSTGFSWQISGLDPNVARVQGEPTFKQDPSVPVAPGAGGTSEWTFVGEGAGVTQLTMDYMRPWEQGIAPAQTFSLTIKVE